MIYNKDFEDTVLSGLIQNPNLYGEFTSILDSSDFQYEANEIIFNVFRQSFLNKEEVSKVLILGKIRNLGLSFRDNINIADYIDGLLMNKVSPAITKQAIKDLKIISARRKYAESCQKIIQGMKKNKEWSFDEISKFVDKNLFKEMDNWLHEDDVIDLFDGMYELIEERGNNPVEEIGIPSPYDNYNQLYGGFKNGNVYVFCARPSEGKTTFLNHTAFYLSNISNNIPCLILDTEMGEENALDVKMRLASSITGINPWYFTTGNWRKVEEYVAKVRDPEFKKVIKNSKLYYKYLTDASIDKIIRTVKSWYYTKVGRGNQCVIVYDYLKVSNEKTSEANKEFQILGDKVNKLKELVGKEVSAPLLSAIQLNRSGDTRKNQQNDDTTAIAMSDRVLWFASYLGIFRKKTMDEINEEGYEYGTHKLITLKGRHLGKDAQNHSMFVKKHDGKLTYDFINFKVDNFKVTEIGKAENMYENLKDVEKVETSKTDKQSNPFEYDSD